MGTRATLILISGKEPDAIYQDLNVRPTGQFADIPESPISGASLPNGQYLLFIFHSSGYQPNLETLSRGASLVECYVNETIMASYVSSWENGRNQWSVHHNLNAGFKNLEIRGETPNQLAPIRDQMFAIQGDSKDVDYIFDVPIELFKALGGIHYDEDPVSDDLDPWQVLVGPQKKSLLARLKCWLFGNKPGTNSESEGA